MTDMTDDDDIPEPEYGWKGNLAKPILFELLQAKKISHTEFCLLMVIDSLDHNDKNKIGACYASDKHLAEKIAVSTQTVSNILVRLKKLGLLVNAGKWRRRRLLKCPWNIEVILPENGKLHLPKSVKAYKATLYGIQKKNTQAAFALQTAAREGLNGNGFYPEKNPKPKYNALEFTMAKRLYAKLQAEKRLVAKAAMKTWAIEFHRLHNQFEPDRVSTVLNWFCDHVKDKYTPWVFSAKSFRQKFLQIENVMARDQESAPVEITPTAKTILKSLSNLIWPEGFDIAQCVQRSLDNYLITRKVLDNLYPFGGKKRKIVLQIKKHYLSYAVDFLQQWFTNAHERVSDWDDWSGNINSIMFSVESKLFQKGFMSCVKEYTSDRNSGALVLTELQDACRKEARNRGTAHSNRYDRQRSGPK